MERLLYEHSVYRRGYLIIPFQLGTIADAMLYSYHLLSELGHKERFHQAENPAGLCSETIEGIVQVAIEHLNQNSDIVSDEDYFRNRYTYRDQLFIILTAAGKYYYDHYPAQGLTNIAAPKIFASEADCLSWIQQQLVGNREFHP
jgi:hypothetical protein